VTNSTGIDGTARRPVFLEAEWRSLVMLNADVNPDVLSPFVPRGTELDEWNGRTYVSLVGFRFVKTRVLGVPIPFHTNFDELNLRFYVRRLAPEGERRGVVFIREIVPRWAIAAVARWVYGENYIAVPMRSDVTLGDGNSGGRASYSWFHRGQWGSLTATCEGPGQALEPGSEAEFITEHYWGYARQRDGSTVEYRVEHPPWRVWKATTHELAADTRALYGEQFGEALERPPVSVFIAEGSPIIVRRGARLENG